MTKTLAPLLAAALLAACSTTAPPAAAPPLATPHVVTCAFKSNGTQYEGSCQIPCMVNALAIDIDGPNPKVSCNTPPRTVAATLAKASGDNWLGTMEGKFPEDPTRFELTAGRGGAASVAKLPYGWFKLHSAQQKGDALVMTIAADKQLPPNSDDIKIIQRALQLVRDTNVWSKKDNRICLPNPQQWSLFCAMTQATEEISGGVHYRQPALQAVREVVNDVGGTRVGKHRLMDYNNHPDTTLKDIHNLLAEAQTRLEKRFR